jgi:crotonobetainyl-CoA:carnitine CoA-transferase CaiB-like acyl-CoA transferase
MNKTVLPLEGIRVLDLSRVLAGPLCTMLLADLGADVIKVERPAGGDDTRGWGPPFDARGESAYFLSVNRNKRSLAADLDRAEDIALVRTLIAGSDVVVENFLPGVLARKGIDIDSMLASNTRLIWCTILGYAAASDRPGYDFAVQAESGWMSVTGATDGEPVKTPVAFVDVLTGKDATIAILAALAGRSGGARSASSRRLSIALDRSALAGLVNVAQNTLVSGRDPVRWGNAHANLVPYQLFATADRPLVVAVGTDAQWQALTRILGDPALADDEEFRTNAGRVTHRARCVAAVQESLRTQSCEHWHTACLAAGVPTGRLRSVREAIAEVDASALTGMPSSVGGVVRDPPPLLGEHTASIRARGWSRDESR